MNLEELKNFINNSEYYGSFDDFCYENFKNIKYKYIETLKTDDHRWYQIDYDVYFFRGIDDLPIGYLCIAEVGTLKNEIMNVEDCYHKLKAYNVKEIIKKSFEIIE